MSPQERERIRAAAVEKGRAERRAQGIPERIEDPGLTARLAGLLREREPEVTPRNTDVPPTGPHGGTSLIGEVSTGPSVLSGRSGL